MLSMYSNIPSTVNTVGFYKPDKRNSSTFWELLLFAFLLRVRCSDRSDSHLYDKYEVELEKLIDGKYWWR